MMNTHQRNLLWLALTLLQIAALGGCANAPRASDAPAIADRATYLSDIHVLLRARWPNNRTVNIVCHGHSVPAGYFNTPQVRMLDAYPHLLHQRLCDAFPTSVNNVIVTAIGGENSVQGAARFARDVLGLHPDVITIDYALNDRKIGLRAARDAWTKMILAAQRSGAKVILLTPTPDTAARLDESDDPLNQHAEQIRMLAAQYHVGLVDSLALFKQHLQEPGSKLADLMAQSNHPNRAGHELIAGALSEWFAVGARETSARSNARE